MVETLTNQRCLSQYILVFDGKIEKFAEIIEFVNKDEIPWEPDNRVE
jgi:hypothetical protein